MRIVVFTLGGSKEASSRLRVIQYKAMAEHRGVLLRILPLMSDFVWANKNSESLTRRSAAAIVLLTRIVLRVAQGLWCALSPGVDKVLVQRELLPWGKPWVESVICRAGKPLVYDIDDGVFLPDRMNGGWRLAFWRAGRVPELIEHASLTIAGGEELREYCLGHASRVRMIRTGVPDHLCAPPRPVSSAQLPTVGWIGGRSSLSSLVDVVAWLEQVHKLVPFLLVVIGARNVLEADFGSLNVERVVWSLDSEAEELRRLRIGLMPIPRTEWARYKCAYKVLQYMAAGIVPVATAHGENVHVIDHGRNGFLIHEEAQWKDTLQGLLTDAAVCRAVALRAYEDARKYRASCTGRALVQALIDA